MKFIIIKKKPTKIVIWTKDETPENYIDVRQNMRGKNGLYFVVKEEQDKFLAYRFTKGLVNITFESIKIPKNDTFEIFIGQVIEDDDDDNSSGKGDFKL